MVAKIAKVSYQNHVCVNRAIADSCKAFSEKSVTLTLTSTKPSAMIYIASSWRNPYYEDVVKRLKKEGLPRWRRIPLDRHRRKRPELDLQGV